MSRFFQFQYVNTHISWPANPKRNLANPLYLVNDFRGFRDIRTFASRRWRRRRSQFIICKSATDREDTL